MYHGLETNVPRNLMTYSDLAYPKDVSLFPAHDKIKQYLEDHASDLKDIIRLNCEVTSVMIITKRYQKKWKLEIKGELDEYFDAVVAATGTFNKFYLPPDLKLIAWER